MVEHRHIAIRAHTGPAHGGEIVQHTLPVVLIPLDRLRRNIEQSLRQQAARPNAPKLAVGERIVSQVDLNKSNNNSEVELSLALDWVTSSAHSYHIRTLASVHCTVPVPLPN